jgi:hypothetical protein
MSFGLKVGHCTAVNENLMCSKYLRQYEKKVALKMTVMPAEDLTFKPSLYI